MKDLAKLRPSTQAPIDLETLRGLPLGGIYRFGLATTVRVRGWGAHGQCHHEALMGGRWQRQDDMAQSWMEKHCADLWRYPLLPRLQFNFEATQEAISTLGDQPSGRRKSVTRRRQCPPGIKPGHLFLAIDRGRTSRAQPPSKGLGVFRAVSVVTVGRYGWSCRTCGLTECSVRADAFRPLCSGCLLPLQRFDLTPEELELEGLPEMTPDSFWRLLEEASNVDDEGRVCRIAFEAAA